MARYTYLVIHCSATQEGQDHGPDFIMNCHTWPLDLEEGKVKWGGTIYNSREELPEDVREKKGRGWTQPGYSLVIALNGMEHVLQDWNGDDWIDAEEVTNGAKGMNSKSRHVCYIGGLSKATGNKPKDTRTNEQKFRLEQIVKREIAGNSALKVLGHNQVASKACPSFNVPKWLRSIGIQEKNIYQEA